jgi:predicted lysophospholipase L1 biosynthesis ABC-type transport system permease subunit
LRQQARLGVAGGGRSLIGRMLFASLRHRGRQLGLIALSILAAAASAALIGAFSHRLEGRLARDLAAFGPNILVRTEPGGPPLPQREIAVVRALDGVAMAVGVRERPLADGAGAEIEVASSEDLLRLHPAWVLAGRWPRAGEVAVGSRAAAGNRVPVGTIATGDRFDGARFVALGEGAVDRIEVRADTARVDAVVRAVAERVPGAEAAALARVRSGDAQLARRLRLLLLGIGGVTLALAALTVGAASAALLAERRVEIGLFLALGYSARRVLGFLAGELLSVALVAAVVGQVLGEWSAASLSRRVLGSGTFGLTALGAVAAVSAALGIVGVAVLVAVQRVSRLNAATVLRGE